MKALVMMCLLLAASDQSLTIMTIFAFLGLPFVLTYTVTIYWVFRGKVRIDRFSY